MPNIHLEFINRSNDANNSTIVIFGKNSGTALSEVSVAWKVIKNCGQGFSHPFSYTSDIQVGIGDSWGNYSPQVDAQLGQSHRAYLNESGTAFAPYNEAASLEEVEIVNQLPMGAIEAQVYRDGRLFATKTGIAPGQKAAFQFKPTIWIGVVSQIEEGQVMNSAILSDINTELSLLGIASANIIMTGGGPGPSSTPFQFHLENIQFA